jgi:hypothetical protein
MVDPGLLRIASNLYAAIAAARAGTPDREAMNLAIRATEASPGPFDDLLEAIRTTITAALDDPEKHPLDHTDLLLLACAAALTPAAPAPDFD